MPRIIRMALLVATAAIAASAARLVGAPAAESRAAAGRQASAREADAVVTVAWLAEHLRDPDVVVISSDAGRPFERGHIPGARSVGHMATLDNDHRLAPKDRVAATLAAAGATDTAHVVLYGSEPMATGWMYMTFAAIGQADRVSMLSGNAEAWRGEGHALETGAGAPAATGRLGVRPAPDVIVDAPWVRARLEDPAIRVLDVRTVEERRAGYVPGSRLVLWQDLFSNLEEGRFKSAGDVKALLVRAGLAPGQEVVTYCAVGMRASLMYFAARYAGVPARVYLGSWQDWSRQPGYPIVRDGG